MCECFLYAPIASSDIHIFISTGRSAVLHSAATIFLTPVDRSIMIYLTVLGISSTSSVRHGTGPSDHSVEHLSIVARKMPRNDCLPHVNLRGLHHRPVLNSVHRGDPIVLRLGNTACHMVIFSHEATVYILSIPLSSVRYPLLINMSVSI
jgi:hypothetical protein